MKNIKYRFNFIFFRWPLRGHNILCWRNYLCPLVCDAILSYFLHSLCIWCLFLDILFYSSFYFLLITETIYFYDFVLFLMSSIKCYCRQIWNQGNTFPYNLVVQRFLSSLLKIKTLLGYISVLISLVFFPLACSVSLNIYRGRLVFF